MSILNDLRNIPVSHVAGNGKKTLASYFALGVESIYDLINLRPRGYEDRTRRVCIGHQVPDGPWTNTIVQVQGKSFFGKGLKNVKVTVKDTESGVRGELLGFNRPYLDKTVVTGAFYKLYAFQMPQAFRMPQFSKFELTALPDSFALTENAEKSISGGLKPVYPLSGNLTQNMVRKHMGLAFSDIPVLENDLPESLYGKYKLISLDKAYRALHAPKSAEDVRQALRTLGFSEIFYMQLLAMRRSSSDGSITRRSVTPQIYEAEKKLLESLPFELTEDQKKVLQEIRKDMSGERSMNRLLQGDVGSGKTLVALVAAVHCAAEGSQVAFMAPTELLARQHAINASRLLAPLGVNVAYLDGTVTGKARALLLKNLREHNIDLVIGTHALFSKDVEYAKLGFVIVDEQHRFGVEQRRALFAKGQNPDVLMMTATPIPRTLALTIYGDLNVSTIKTMPGGRLPVKTYIAPPEKRQAMYDSVHVELQRGHQAYFVYPRIGDGEEEEESSLKDVVSMYSYLSERYSSFHGALIHSHLPDDEKIKILEDFNSGKISFLVSTSVVEVGIDVPNATCMVIEHADFFGLSALHQLRGRVGRGKLQSWCFLAPGDNVSKDGMKRLEVLKSTNDGFVIAEQDLLIRGPGEISGLRQSGFTNLKFVSLDKDLNMIAAARDEVSQILATDSGLLEADHAVLRRALLELQSF
ncbi:MAG: ATP-dependent DNA helicase RecG [Sphaerochaetaceae bacterium]|nr:ATP-dependent DNA helicase RecG [Sphaerochaetaceae bacterium]